MDYFLSAITDNYANFSGRARRAEYWFFSLFYFISAMVGSVIDAIIGIPLFTIVDAWPTHSQHRGLVPPFTRYQSFGLVELSELHSSGGRHCVAGIFTVRQR